MGMGFAPTWLRQVSPPASQNHFNHCSPPSALRVNLHRASVVTKNNKRVPTAKKINTRANGATTAHKETTRDTERYH